MTIVVVKDEIALLNRARALDNDALGEIHDAYYADIYRYLLMRVADSPTAEDLTSEVFVRFLHALRNKNAPQNTIRGWLYGAASLVLKEHYRAKKRAGHAVLHDNLPDNAPSPEQRAQGALERERLYAALAQLTADQRRALELRYGFSASVRQTAQLMGKSEGSVKMLQLRALAALAKILEGVKTLLF